MIVRTPGARGIGRVADNEQALILYFDRKPTDDEMRAIHVICGGVGVVVEVDDGEVPLKN
jgi:hypothetical protein